MTNVEFSSFKTTQAYQRHIQTNKHKMRQENTRQDLIQCKKCNKWYCGLTGISHHKQICRSPAPIKNEKNPNDLQQQIDDMKEAFEKERQEMKIAFEESKKERVNKNNKRKKINKDTRQRIAEEQKNRCGDCKLALTPYFELDHIIGLQFGGTDEESNLLALCRECHAKKSITENQCRKQIQDSIQTILKGKVRNTNVVDDDLRKRLEACENELKEFRAIFAQFSVKKSK